LASFAAPLCAAPPTVTTLFPSGGQRGTEVVVTANGNFSTWPVEVWTDRPGVTAKSEADKGKLRVTIAADCPPGVAWLRLYTAEGSAAARAFLVEQLPEIEEAEPNDAPEKPQAVAAQQVVNGRLQKSGDVDGFAVPLKQGETLIASLRAHGVLGSSIDGVLQICEVRERKFSSVAGSPPQIDAFVLAQNNDAVGLDPQLVFVAPRDATYLVRVFGFSAEPDSTIGFAGGDKHVYRLTLTTGGFVECALPKIDGSLQLFGPGLSVEGIAGQRSGDVAFAPGVAGQTLVPSAQRLMTGPTDQPLALSDFTPPLAVMGRLAAPQAKAELRLTANKGKPLEIAVRSRSLGYPLDAVLTIDDAMGKTLQRVDDSDKSADPQLTFNPPADGEYVLRLRDLHRRGGPRFAYWLEISLAVPRFTLALAGDVTLMPGKTVEVPVTIARHHGHAANIMISATGPNGAPLPHGVTAAVVTSEPKGDSAKAVKLVLTATPDAPPGGFPLIISGREENGPTVIARPADTVLFADVPANVWLTVVKP
jgi:hypothetical protein